MKPKPVCSKCGRRLTDPHSIAVGMGPECRGGAAKAGKKLPKPKWKVSGGRVQLVGLNASEPFNPGEKGKMMTWMRAKPGEKAHLIRLFGESFFTTACREFMPRENAIDAPATKTALANRPGEYYMKPNDEPVCEICLNKARSS